MSVSLVKYPVLSEADTATALHRQAELMEWVGSLSPAEFTSRIATLAGWVAALDDGVPPIDRSLPVAVAILTCLSSNE